MALRPVTFMGVNMYKGAHGGQRRVPGLLQITDLKDSPDSRPLIRHHMGQWRSRSACLGYAMPDGVH